MSLRCRIFAAMYDGQMRRAEKAGLIDMRQALVGQAAGTVLEIGAGTGANLSHYPPAVTSLTLTEPDVFMFKRLERRARAEVPAIMVLRAPAEDLPFEGETFDVVVSTLVLCGVDDQPRAVREIRRVLRPGGRFLFLEHVRAADPTAAKKQDRMNWLNRAVVCCDCNRPTLETIEGAGFRVTALEHTELPKAPSFVRPAIAGTAIPPAATGHAATGDQSVKTRSD
jgi:ubiquinone/menaquinone biosynthesis C-methylase UbiE